MKKSEINTTISLPLFVNTNSIRVERKENYINQGLSFYQGIEKLTAEEYKKIKQELENGNNSILRLLCEKSIYSIIVSVSNIYSKFDIEAVLPYSDYLSQTILIAST